MTTRVLLNNFNNLQSNYIYSESDPKNFQYISIEDFEYIINFLHDNKHIILGGSDPILHPQIDKILSIAMSRNDVHYSFESHLLYNQKTLSSIVKKLGASSYICILNIIDEFHNNTLKTLKTNIKYLQDQNKKVEGRIVIDHNTRIDKLIDFIKDSGLKKISWEPNFFINNTHLRESNIVEFYTLVKEKAIQLIEHGLHYNISTFNKCGNIPICMLNHEEIKLFAYSSGAYYSNLCNFVCEPSIIISPDLKAYRCKIIEEYIDIKELKNFSQLYRLFVSELDRKKYNSNIFKKCSDCIIKDSTRKCGCLQFKEIPL